jgi:hypothetical protein
MGGITTNSKEGHCKFLGKVKLISFILMRTLFHAMLTDDSINAKES